MRTENQNAQVDDDLKLLDLMMSDIPKDSEFYAPTNYWSVYEKKFVPELKSIGLKDFRRRENSVLESFGATDLNSSFDNINLYENLFFYNRFSRKIPLYTKALTAFNSFLNNILKARIEKKSAIIKKESFENVKNIARQANALPLENFEASLVGNPIDIYNVNGKNYTRANMYYYLRYVFCQKNLDFNKINTIVELGSGSGKQVEVLKKLYPHLTFILFDIPPQLYVCEQYLKKVFPDTVVSFAETRGMVNLDNLEKGKIYIFGNWKFPILVNFKMDLFWNAASFQEMEPHVVLNYLSFINPNAQYVYLQEEMKGKEVAHKKGKFGVLRKTTIDDYKKGLSNFEIADLARTLLPLGKMKTSEESFWKRKNK